MAQYTISHSEQTKGWTSFWGYIPDWFARLGNKFYTIKNGQLWLHHDKSNSGMNNFYGNQSFSTIKTVFNEAMADDKVFKTIVLESNQKWKITSLTNLTESTINADEFNTRESRQFAFMRQNENSSDYSGGTVQGIGVITSVAGTTITFSHAPDFVNTGDILVQLNGLTEEVIGEIIEVNDNQITVEAIITTPVNGYFSYAKKNARAEGGDVRGYYMEVLLENNEVVQGELFAISTEAVKSYV